MGSIPPGRLAGVRLTAEALPVEDGGHVHRLAGVQRRSDRWRGHRLAVPRYLLIGAAGTREVAAKAARRTRARPAQAVARTDAPRPRAHPLVRLPDARDRHDARGMPAAPDRDRRARRRDAGRQGGVGADRALPPRPPGADGLTRPGGFEPPTRGLEVRRSVP